VDEILGYDSGSEATQRISNSWDQLWAAPQERARLGELMLQHGAVRGYECQFKRENGALIWVAISARLIRGEGGEPLYYHGFLEEVTERKQMELALRKSREEFGQVFASSAAGMARYDLENGGLLIAVNEAFERLFGYRSEEVVGQRAAEIPLWPISEQLASARDLLRDTGRLRNLELQFRRK